MQGQHCRLPLLLLSGPLNCQVRLDSSEFGGGFVVSIFIAEVIHKEPHMALIDSKFNYVLFLGAVALGCS
jgi:hypothetical protein